MKRFIAFLLALNIFLCYGGLCDLCHEAIASENTNSDCHSMGQMENETAKADNPLPNDKYSVSEYEVDSLCQYFLVSKSFKLSNDIYDGIAIVNPIYLKQNNYNYIFDKSGLKIPDRALPTELFIKNSSYLI